MSRISLPPWLLRSEAGRVLAPERVDGELGPDQVLSPIYCREVRDVFGRIGFTWPGDWLCFSAVLTVIVSEKAVSRSSQAREICWSARP